MKSAGLKHSKILIAVLAVIPLLSASACLWDSDTLAEEVTEGGETQFILEAITGRFDRFPARYYEMRLERIVTELPEATGIKALEMCDDAGVACDRLGWPNDAIYWMGKKMDLLSEGTFDKETLSDHRYRYHANIGTFYVHRWLMSAKEMRFEKDLQNGRDHIQTALKINPDAHFGREWVQQEAIDWIIHSLELAKELDEPLGIPFSINSEESSAVGLAGMIRLGAAWESPDIFYALGNDLYHSRHGNLAYLADLRLWELGEKDGLFGYNRKKDGGIPDSLQNQKASVEKYWKEARSEAKAWRTERYAFMEKQFALGKHPDTNADFWDGYVSSTTPPELPDEGGESTFRRYQVIGFWIMVGLMLLVPLWIISLMRRSAAKSRRAAEAA